MPLLPAGRFGQVTLTFKIIITENYEKVLKALKGGPPIRKEWNFILCDTWFLSYHTTAADVFGGYAKPGQSVKEYIGEQIPKPPEGVWRDEEGYHDEEMKSYHYLLGNEYDETGQKRLCYDKGPFAVTSFTHYNARHIVFCPGFWNDQTFQKGLAPIKEATGRPSWYDLEVRAGTFLHEMMHWIDTRPWIGDQQITLRSGRKATAYGLNGVYQLTLENRDEKRENMILNAESYYVFAAMALAKDAIVVPENINLVLPTTTSSIPKPTTSST